MKSFLHLNRVPEVLRCLGRCEQPLPVICRYLGLVSGKCSYPVAFRLSNGIVIDLYNYHDLVTAWIVFLRREYKIPQGARNVLDIGANIGCFSLEAASKHAVRSIAIEPYPSTFSRLTANVRRNSMEDHIQCWELAVAGASGLRRMQPGALAQSVGLLESQAIAGIQVEAASLREILGRACETFRSRSIDFVKMDIEGGEHEAILAMSPSDLRPIEHLAMEYHPNAPKGRLFEHLLAAGLRLQDDRVVHPNSGVAHFRR
jgi:FkbM family methyltransferase